MSDSLSPRKTGVDATAAAKDVAADKAATTHQTPRGQPPTSRQISTAADAKDVAADTAVVAAGAKGDFDRMSQLKIKSFMFPRLILIECLS